jgi:hypothetical protein
MGEADLIQALVEALEVVLAIVSIYFSVVAAYVSALWFFLRRSPFLMKAVAWLIFTGALIFIALSIVGTERLTAGLFQALEALPERSVLPPAQNMYMGLESTLAYHHEYAIIAGFIVAIAMYLCLFYLTFLHRWQEER